MWHDQAGTPVFSRRIACPALEGPVKDRHRGKPVIVGDVFQALVGVDQFEDREVAP